MGLLSWFRDLFASEPEEDIEKHALHNQRWIMKTTLSIFIILLIIMIFSVNSPNYERLKEILNIFLPLLTTWIGAIIAFYFSKEFSDMLIKQINQQKNKNKKVSEDVNELETKYRTEKKELSLKYQETILGLLKEIDSLKNTKKSKKEGKK